MWETEINGQKYYQERFTDPFTGKEHTLSVQIKKDTPSGRKNARARLMMKINDRAPTEDLKLSDLIEAFEHEKSLTVRDSTSMRYHFSLRLMLNILGDIYVNNLTAGYVKKKLLDTGNSNDTLNGYLKRFKTLLRWAYRNDMLPDAGIIEKLTYFPSTSYRERIRDKYLETEELEILLDSMDNPRWKLLTEFLVLSGLRIGEALALNKNDIRNGVIYIDKTMNLHKGTIGPAKTASSRREVFVQDELADCISRVREFMKTQRQVLGYSENIALFVAPTGKRCCYVSYYNYLDEKGKDVLHKKVTPHTLRHTHVSLMAAAGINLDIISRRLGHESSKITRAVYYHVTNKQKEKDRELIQNISLLK